MGGVAFEVRSRSQINIGRRLGARHFMATENAPFKMRHELDMRQLHFYFESVGTRSASNGTLSKFVSCSNGLVRTGHYLQTCLKRIVAAQSESVHPFFGQRQACACFNFCFVIFHGFAHKITKAFFAGHGPTTLFQHVSQHAIGNGLAVNQHAIAIKEYRLKFHDGMGMGISMGKFKVYKVKPVLVE
jgi:hypothetical protein